MAFCRAASLNDLWQGEMTGCIVGGRNVLLVRADDMVYAYEDRCAHLGVRLSTGSLQGSVIVCAAHAYQYDACTGRGINPRTVCLTRFPVRIEAGEILVDVAQLNSGTG